MNENPITHFSARLIKKIPPGSVKLLLFAIPPFHLLYLYAVARFVQVEKTRGPKTLLFYVLGLMGVALISAALVLMNQPKVASEQLLSGQLLLFSYGLFCLYLMFLMHLTMITVDFDRRRASHRFFDFTDMDYFMRFITLLCLPVTIWSFHSRIRGSGFDPDSIVLADEIDMKELENTGKSSKSTM